MRRNRVRSFVTRDGRVVRARAEEVQAGSPRRRPARAEGSMRAPARRRPARQDRRRPAGAGGRAPGRAAAGGGGDMARLAAFMRLATFILLGIVCVFVITLVVAGIYEAGKWIFGGERDRTTDVVRSESARRDMETVNSQKPLSRRRSFSYPGTRSGVDEESRDMSLNQGMQSRSETGTYGQRRRRREIPAISREPAVNYWATIKEMEDVLEARSTEIRKVIENLHNPGRSDEGD